MKFSSIISNLGEIVIESTFQNYTIGTNTNVSRTLMELYWKINRNFHKKTGNEFLIWAE